MCFAVCARCRMLRVPVTFLAYINALRLSPAAPVQRELATCCYSEGSTPNSIDVVMRRVYGALLGRWLCWLCAESVLTPNSSIFAFDRLLPSKQKNHKKKTVSFTNESASTPLCRLCIQRIRYLWVTQHSWQRRLF